MQGLRMRQSAASTADHGANSIEVHNLSHCFAVRSGKGSSYTPTKVLEDISINVAKQTFVCIVGPSGCGKTTLLNIIAGHELLQHGKVTIAGKDPRAGMHEVAYMLARDALLPWLTVRENASFGLRMRGKNKNEVGTAVDALLEEVGLTSFANERPHHLSQGMRQRTALVRTFAMSSEILLMDEPFGALDAQTKHVLQGVLTSLWERDRRTVMMVTHDIHEAILLADEVIVMGARPGTIKSIIKVGYDRPRDVDALLASHAVADQYAEIRGLLDASHDSQK